jgi:dTDP-4-amino-4,6-dideoxygalactose transaminase
VTSEHQQVPFLEPRAGYLELRDELDAAYQRVMGSGRYILGAELERFEESFAAFCGAPAAVGVANGLDALALALAAAGIGPGDEVIVPAQTFVASWLAVSRVGAVPVPVDVDPATVTLDAHAAAAAVGPRTAALMPVHLYGHPADMDAICELARRHGLFVLEDAAQAHGALLHGRRAGALGDAAGFSFYPGKNLGAFGDGGGVTGGRELCATVRSLQNYGSTERYAHDDVRGVNSRLDPLQAAFLGVKLTRLERWNARRREIAERYRDALTAAPEIALPCVADGVEPVWHLFVVRHPERDALARFLGERGIGTLVHYPTPPHLTPAYAHLGCGPGAFPEAEAAARTCLSLPIGPHLSDEQVDRVIDAVLSYRSSGLAAASIES